MKVQRITFLGAALALAAAPVAFGADAPKGSHGQETDTARAPVAQISIRCAGTSTTALAARSAAFAAPRGSHGQETDHRTGSQFTVRLACISRSAAGLATRPSFKAISPKGSHGQETDQPRAHS
jgi:hypothetical protein